MSNEKEYSQVFVLPDESEKKVLNSYMGRYLALPIQRIYQKPEHQCDNYLMDEKWNNIDCKKVEVHKNYINMDTMEKRPAIETMILAENKNWVEYPLVSYYTGEHAMNCEYFTKIEVVLLDEKYSRRLFFSWKGTLTVADFMDNCVSQIMDEIIKNPSEYHAEIEDEDSNKPIIHLEFYSSDGEAVMLELDGERGIEDRIASIRVVEFTETIVEKV